jgi:hypothetical protein
VNKRFQRLLGEIEAGASDQKTPIGDLLRKVIILGGQAESAKMRDWATYELRGYGREDELPEYRVFTAPLQIDWMNMARWVRGETISSLELPDFARDVITDEVTLRYGIAQIEELARRCEPGDVVKLAPPGSQELVTLMNAKRPGAQLERLYWGVSPVVLWGVADQVRTRLTAMIAEIRATMPQGMEIPSPEVANHAYQVAVEGSKRTTINFTAATGGSAVTASAEKESRHWVRIAAAVVVGLLTIAGVVFALMQAQGWQFGG